MITAKKLNFLEQKYEGFQKINGKRGAGRMLYKVRGSNAVSHSYATLYATYLPKKIGVLIELGILKGAGLAIWADVYPKGRIIGLDKDLLPFKEFKNSLRTWGAFRQNDVEVYQFDKFSKTAPEQYKEILKNQTIDVYIDDSNHSTYSMIKAFEDVVPFLRKEAVCFLEDNDEVGEWLYNKYGHKYTFHIEGKMTIIQM